LARTRRRECSSLRGVPYRFWFRRALAGEECPYFLQGKKEAQAIIVEASEAIAEIEACGVLIWRWPW
jgi:hypothetical protein